jgi:hypothetical protein
MDIDDNEKEIIDDVVIDDKGENGVTEEVKNKTSEEIEAAIIASFKDGEVTDPEVELQTTKTDETKKEEKTEELPEVKHNPIWDTIKEEYEAELGVGTFKMPEGITPETESKILLDWLTENINTGTNLEGIPDTAKEIIDLHSKGQYDEKKWIEGRLQQKAFLEMPDTDILFSVYKNEYGKTDQNTEGSTDEEISEHINKMTKLEQSIEAKKIKSQYQQITKERQAKEIELAKQTVENNLINLNKEKDTIADKLINAYKNKEELLGISFSKAEIVEYQKFFKEAVKINPKTGTSSLYDLLLQSDETLYELGAILWKGGGKAIKAKIAEAKNQVKDTIEKKLGVKADITANSSSKTGVDLVDWKKWKGEDKTD